MTPPTDRSTARHEAAHAVVAVRLDLALSYTSIQRGTAAGDGSIRAEAQRTAPPGKVLVSAGVTVLERDPLARSEAAFPNPQARAHLEKVPVYQAAGIVAEAKMGVGLHDEANRNDLDYLMRQAETLLGITFNHADSPPAVREWLAAQIKEADRVLHVDGGAAWDRVMAALLRKNDLIGDEVRALVAEADRESGFAGR